MAISIEELFRRGVASFQTGKLEDAERCFKKVLRQVPKHVAALNLLAIVLTELKKYKEAEPYLQSALNINSKSDVTFYNYGIILKALKRPSDALERFNQALSINSTVAETWNNRGTVLSDLRRYGEAIADFDRAILLNSNYSDAYCNKGKSLFELKCHNEALEAYEEAIALKADLAEAWLGRGNVFADLRRYIEAFAAYDRALVLKPDLADAWLGRGNVFGNRKQYDEAFAAYDKALALKPDSAEAWNGQGNCFVELKRYDEALTAYDKALELKPDSAEAWLGRGNAFCELKRHDEALTAYDTALALKPDLAEAWLGRGNVFGDLKRYNEAFAAYDKGLVLKPDLAAAWVGRGNVLYALTRHDEAVTAYDAAIAFKPDLAEPWFGRGNVFSELRNYDEALAAYDRALALSPDLTAAEGARLHAKMHLCDWSNFDTESRHLISSIRNGVAAAVPFVLLPILSSPADQLKCARLHCAKSLSSSEKRTWRIERHKHRRIRVAYLSADFREHPVSYLLANVFELHDRRNFETIAVSFGPDSPSEIRARLENSFEKFMDVKNQSDIDVAKLLRTLEVDIAVDLMGHTKDSRIAIFAHGAAPIQVTYLGYPGTMGGDFMDYLIADDIVIPAAHREYYAEKVIYLPYSYMPTDSAKRYISDRPFERAEMGLPPNGFVFCSFNNSYKLNPTIFDCWMRILKKVDGSVLWLSENNENATANLKKEARIRGVDPHRLVFAKRLPSSADHLARHRLASLFLDTSPYSAHTTASDALWAGLPVLTQIGETFAGRVAASLLHALDLPELITQTQEEYEKRAVQLATNPVELVLLNKKLAINRVTTPLFNTELFTRHIEAAYSAMYERYQAELPADHMYVRR